VDERMKLPIAAEESLEEVVPVAPGGTLFLDLDRGSVEIESHERDEVWIRAESRGWGSHHVSFHLDREGNDVEFEADVDRWLGALLFGMRIRVQARVPSRYSIDLRSGGGSATVEGIGGHLLLETAGGSVRIRRIDGTANVRTAGGSVRARDVSGDLRLHTSGGSIRAEDVGGRVDARTAGGSIKLQEVGGPVEARTVGGSVKVSFLDQPEGTLSTGGGSVHVEFPSDAGADLDARTQGGRIHVEHSHVPRESSRRRLVAEINGGGPALELRTLGGSIRVNETPPYRARSRAGSSG
jgi:hypothetical protein